MDDILVSVGSITSATRLAKRLSRQGDKRARVVSTPKEIGGGGCAYSVRASGENEQFIRNNLHGVSIKGIFKVSEGNYYDIS